MIFYIILFTNSPINYRINIFITIINRQYLCASPSVDNALHHKQLMLLYLLLNQHCGLQGTF